MQISSNITLGTQVQLQRTTAAITRSLERLSTGKRVNSPKDDPATYSLGVTLQSQIRGLTQGNINTNVTMGLLQTADGALESQNEILTRLREIAVQASSSSLTTSERESLNDEVQSLLEEFRRITADTEFNGMQLLDGSFGTQTIQVGANSGDEVELYIPSLQASDVFTKQVGSGNFNARTTLFGETGPAALEFGDFNQDGNIDIAASVVGSGSAGTLVQIFDGRGDGTFQQRRTYSVGTNPLEMKVGDVTGDGLLDIITVDVADDTISILRGNGDGTFDVRSTIATEDQPADVQLADINRDGALDLVSVSRTQNMVSINLNNGDGTFQTRQTYMTGSTTNTLAVADLNGDGYADIAAANSGSANVTVLLGSSSGTFTNAATVAVGTTPQGIVLSDFDLDGDLDMAVVNAGTNNVSILVNNGIASFTAGTTLTAGTKPEDIEAADMNNDGITDLLVMNEDTRNISIFLGNGANSFAISTTLSAGGATTFGGFDVGVADLNNDGVLDVVNVDSGNTANYDGNQLSVFLQVARTVSAESDVSVASQAKAEALMKIIDTAIANINNERASLASVHSRLEQVFAANLLLVENYSDALSSATDADVALEIAELVKNQILQQAQVAVLAQANTQMQVVLGLLRA